MTLPLLAQATLSEDTAMTVRLAWILGGAIVLAVWWAGREFQRGVERDKALTAHAERLTALEDWRRAAEVQAGEMRQEMGELRRLLERIAADVKDIQRTVHQQHHDTRKSAQEAA